MKRILTTITGLLLFSALSAQSLHTLSGIILDDQDRPLPGANIYLPELEKGTVSDQQGYFMVRDIPEGKFVLNISFIGFETDIRTIFVSEADQGLTISLKPAHITGKEVVISGGRYSSQHKNAVKIELLKLGEITEYNGASLVEDLRVIPGVDLISGGGGINTPVIRGLATSNILFLNNGIRLENYQFSQDHPYLVDESGISQVEIIKGPASLLYGSGAIGGVINMVQDYAVEPDAISGEVTLKYFSNESGLNGNVGIHGNRGRISWSMHGGMKSFRDYTDGNGDQVYNSRFNGATLKSFIGLRLDNSLHRLRYEYQQFKPGMANEESRGLVTDNNRTHVYWYQDLDNHLVSSTNSWFLNRFKVHANASFQKNIRKLITDEPGHHAVDMALSTFTYEGRGNLTTSEISEFTFAIQGLRQQNTNLEGEIRVLPDYVFNDLAAFGMVQHDFTNNVHLQIGFRFDNRFLDVPTQEKAGHSHEAPDPGTEPEMMDGFNRYYGNVSGSIGATYELGEGVLLRGNFASAYRAPSVAELTQDGVHGIRYEQGNRDLNSQRNYEFDLSFHLHREFLMLDIAGYYDYINNYIFLSHTSDTTADGLIIYRYLQNDASLYGTEAVLEVLPMKGLSIKAAYNLTRGRQSGTDNLPFIPHDRLRLEVKYTLLLPSEKRSLYLKAGSDYAFAQGRPALNETATPAYFLLHAGTGLDIRMADHLLSFSIQVKNLLNRAYVDHLSMLKEVGYLNSGRNIVFSLTVPFHFHTKE